MKYVERVLQPDETVIYTTRFHWLIYGRAFMFGVVAAVFLFAGQQSEGNASIAFYAVSTLFALYALFRWSLAAVRRVTTEFAVTDRRIIYKTGLILRRTLEMDRSKVESVGINQSVLGRIFNFGTVLLRGTGGTYEPIYFIREPLTFRSHITAG
jgi:uncharacterized membrane protein YdbT with pleckstrin-like domain